MFLNEKERETNKILKQRYCLPDIEGESFCTLLYYNSLPSWLLNTHSTWVLLVPFPISYIEGLHASDWQNIRLHAYTGANTTHWIGDVPDGEVAWAGVLIIHNGHFVLVRMNDHFSDGKAEAGPHRVGIGHGEEAHQTKDVPLGNACCNKIRRSL